MMTAELPTTPNDGESATLPRGWRRVPMRDICVRMDYGFTASADFSTKEPRFLRITDIQDGCVDWASVPGCKISKDEAEENRLEDGDIVFARTGATTGKSFLISNPPKAVFASYLIRLRLNPGVSSEFISLFLQGEDYWKQIRAGARGGIQPNFNATMLGALSVLLPPLAEQRRIAGRLREQLTAVAQARAAVQAQLDAAQALPAAHLRAVFNSHSAQRWPKRRIGDFAFVQSGYAFKSEWFTAEGIRLLRNANVAQDRFDWSDTVRLPASRRQEFPAYELNEGDIILSLDRPIVSGGLKVARVTNSDLPALLLQRVGRFQLKDGIHSDYLYHFLHTQDFIGSITAHDQSLGVPHISPKQAENVELPLPPLAEQRRLAARVTAELSGTRTLADHLLSRLGALDHLPDALLRVAFNGKV